MNQTIQKPTKLIKIFIKDTEKRTTIDNTRKCTQLDFYSMSENPFYEIPRKLFRKNSSEKLVVGCHERIPEENTQSISEYSQNYSKARKRVNFGDEFEFDNVKDTSSIDSQDMGNFIFDNDSSNIKNEKSSIYEARPFSAYEEEYVNADNKDTVSYANKENTLSKNVNKIDNSYEINQLLVLNKLKGDLFSLKEAPQYNSSQNLSLKFILQSLENDIRIRQYKKDENELSIEFYSVEDSISFYSQFYKHVKMTFKPEHELSIFLSDSSSWFKDFKFTSIFMNPHPTDYSCLDDCELEKFEKYNSKESSEHKTGKNPITGIPAQTSRNSGIQLDDSMEMFESKVSYYSKMKNFYSKNDIKKIQGLVEANQLEFIYENIKDLSVGAISNVVIQSLVKELEEKQLNRVIDCLGEDIPEICSTKYGAYTIQALILACKSPSHKEKLVQYFGPKGKYLINHEIGNYSLQKMLLIDEEYVFNIFIDNLLEVFSYDLGFKVFKRCLEFFQNKKSTILNKLNKIRSQVDQSKLEELFLILN